ncbi:phage holin, LLH family [Weissella paramesenteroides]|uniref:phage holin, LLH family n=1 Tax=Weissella paramesenteroides TaxID=1249 RepID=UPI0023A91C53|nr:phage holin, LLH family [Weissella paramesenteroides]WEA52228.1 phage holin, LLH family [Weissella paramesenteroides]
MTLQQAGDIILFLWNTGLLTAVAYAASRFLVAHTKNKNLLLLNEWAMQAVQYAETHLHSSTDKKKAALSLLTERLNANKLGMKFDDKQLDTVIELAVRELKGGK